MPLSIATWNINSVRLRIDIVGAFLKAYQPDILCLQEIKCRTQEFPSRSFKRRGYPHMAVNGQLGYHGVAIVSKRPILSQFNRGFCGINDARHIHVTVEDGGHELAVHNFYVPAGGDEPDPAINRKFAHKLAFLEEVRDWLKGPEVERPSVMVGDLNVAPLEHDVWSHRQLLKVVSYTPAETERLELLRAAGGWIDAVRHFVAPPERLYTWWSYRARDWELSDRGRRLDHIWVTPPLLPRLSKVEVVKPARGWRRPSDHVPVMLTLWDAA